MKKLHALLASAAAVALLTGCAAGPTEPDEDTVPTAESTECDLPAGWDLRDAAPDKLVTDDLGTYCAITVNPTAVAATFDGTNYFTDLLSESGFTTEQVEELYDKAIHFVIEEYLDSEVLDTLPADGTFTGNRAWFDANPSFFNFREEWAESDPLAGLNGFVPLARDGLTRLSNVTLNFKGGGVYLQDNPSRYVSAYWFDGEADYQVAGAEKPKSHHVKYTLTIGFTPDGKADGHTWTINGVNSAGEVDDQELEPLIPGINARYGD